MQKRLGSRIRSLFKRLGKKRLADGTSIGGTGRVSKRRIDKLQVSYGKEIRGNTYNFESMRQAVIAIWHQPKSTDENPDHDLCPQGEDSWCGFQRDIANGTSDYKHDHHIPKAISDVA